MEHNLILHFLNHLDGNMRAVCTTLLPELLDPRTDWREFFADNTDSSVDMTAVSGGFQWLCEQLIRGLSEEAIDTFQTARNDLERIKLLYSASIKIPTAIHSSGKNVEEAAVKKCSGNKLFELRKFREAINVYNEGVILCNAGDVKVQTLLAVLIANRSAVLFELNLFEQVLEDIEWVHNSGWYPKNLKHKTILRKAKALIMLDSLEEAKVLLKSLKDQAATYRLPEPKLQEIHGLIIKAEAKKKRTPDLDFAKEDIPPPKFEPNPMYPAATKFLTFREDAVQGRYSVATSDIPPGSIIVEEEPHTSVLSEEAISTHCTNCMKHTLNPYPCLKCCYAQFCSEKCREEAAVFHSIECSIIATVYKSGASINCIMSLRVITQKPFEYYWSKKDILGTVPAGIYDGTDYLRLYNLCTHAERRNKAEFVHYSFMAIYMLRLLKTTAYFPYETTDALTEEEAFIGSLLLRHLQLLQFNAHELSELWNTVQHVSSYKNCHVGGGIFPTLSLFNHSCEPSIIRYNKGTKMVARSIKQIFAGDIIYENYGPIYSSEKVAVRRTKMVDRYWFECQCIPCLKDWPLYMDMTHHILPLKCLRCKGLVPVDRLNSSPQVKCPQCKSDINIFGAIVKLMQVDDYTTKAEQHFVAGQYERAIAFYRCALETYADHMTPPFPDLVQIQQRLRICMLHDGNTEVLYKKPSAFVPLELS